MPLENMTLYLAGWKKHGGVKTARQHG